MIRVFISQPMSGLTDEEIAIAREKAIEDIYQLLPNEEIEIIKTNWSSVDPTCNHCAYLGLAIIDLARVDFAYFVEGWETKRGCKLEHLVCEEYGIKILKDTECRLKDGDIVIHFKHENDSAKLKYIYRIINMNVRNTETNERMVTYKNIQSGAIFARPYDMFMSEVDHEKYPDIKQKYRLELYKGDI